MSNRIFADSKTSKVILTGLMMAMIAFSTIILIIPVPFTGGYVHVGDCMIFLSVFLLGWKYGAFAAGIGSALADLFVGFANWAPWTLCIKGLMAILMGFAIEKCMKRRRNIVLTSMAAAAVWVGFNFGVRGLVDYQATHNILSLAVEDTELSALGEVVNQIQLQLMLMALLIPVFLLMVILFVRIREHVVIPIYQILGMTIAGLWMVFGYYIAEGLMYGNFAVAAFSMPWNMVQFIMGFFIALFIKAALDKTPLKRYFAY